jgi:serine protease Do
MMAIQFTSRWNSRGILPGIACIALCAGFADAAHSQDTALNTREQDESILVGIRVAPKAFRAAAARISPSLVTIESFGGSSAIAGRIGGIRQRGEGNTTGLVISPDGLIVTSSFNFIEQPKVITVITHDGNRHVARVLGRDDTRRICLLKMDDVEGLPVPEQVPAGQIFVGQWAISVGVGYGDTNPAISSGIISALGRFAGKAIQTDANISPANYGGPLVDLEGRVLGICVPMSGEGQELASGVEWYDSGIGFAIPLAGLEPVLERMSRGIHIQRAFLGIQSENSESEAGPEGVLVTSIVRGSAAEKSGLQVGDVLLKLNDRPIPNIAELRTAIGDFYAGDKVIMVFRRGADEQTKEIELGAPVREDAEDTPSLFPGKRK